MLKMPQIQHESILKRPIHIFTAQIQSQEAHKLMKFLFQNKDKDLLSSSVKPGTHFLENNKIIGVFTMLKLCVSKEQLA